MKDNNKWYKFSAPNEHFENQHLSSDARGQNILKFKAH